LIQIDKGEIILNAGKSIGIAALIIAVGSLFIPMAGIFVSWVALLLAFLASRKGELIFSTATMLVSAVTYLFWSSPFLLLFGGNAAPLVYICFVMLMLPIMPRVFRLIRSRHATKVSTDEEGKNN